MYSIVVARVATRGFTFQKKKAWCFKVTFHDYIYGIFRSKNRKHAIYFLCLAKGQVHLAEKFSHALQQIEWLALCHL